MAIAGALATTAPSLNEMSVRNPIALLPADAPSSAAARQMTEAFKDAGSDNLLVVLLTNDQGLGPQDEQVYRTLVDRLKRDPADVVMVQDLTSTPLLRDTLASKDGKAWILPVGLAGELGTPKANDAFLRVSALVKETVNGTRLTAMMTGPAATVADLTEAGANDRTPIELAIGVLLLVILTVIYRNPVTMVLPLLTIGAALVASQGIIAAISLQTGLPISNQSIVMLSAMIAGAGTDYAVFLISRYHDYIRRGADPDAAVQQAMVSIGRVIMASAATVGITFLGMGFAKLGVFATTGVVLAIAIAVAFVAAVTLLPAVMVLVGRRGWINPRAERAARFWGRMGVRIVRRPARYLVASLVILIGLAACSSLIRYNYDDRKVLPATMASSRGYAELDRHFSTNQTIPQYLLIESAQDLRNPRALADLDQMAQRVSQVPDIFAVRGVTRPGGDTLPQARATFQAGKVGEQLGGAAEQINGRTGDLDRLSSGAEQLALSLGDVRGQVQQAVGNAGGLIDALGYLQAVGGGDKTFAQIDRAARLVTAINALGATIDAYFGRLSANFDWLDPVVVALDTSQFCDSSQICGAARGEFHRLLDARNSGALEKIAALGRQMQLTQGLSRVSTTVEDLSNSLKSIVTALNSVGMTDPASARAQLFTLQSGADELAGASRQIADGVELLVTETKKIGKGLDQASSFLVQMGETASTPAMSGFNIPPGVLNSDQFRTATKAFVSPDGHAVRYLVQTSLNPFSPEAMDQVNAILEAARGAQPNTTLADAKVSLSGYPVTLRDTRDYYDRDLWLIIGVTIVVVLLILMLLLRAVVAPFYLVGSVILSFLSAVGIGVLVLQFLLHQQLHWSVAGLAFVVLVAVGADYNMLLASRMRDESGAGLRSGIIRTVRSTGGVITAAGLIFSASMFGLLFSSIATVAQAGFIIGVGILLDTFVVRTITVPAVATLLGRAGWWPSRPWLRSAAEKPSDAAQLSPAE